MKREPLTLFHPGPSAAPGMAGGFQPLKIAVIAHLKYPIAEPFAGGLEMHTEMLVSQLIALGHQVTLFAADGSDTRLNVEPICERTMIEQAGIAEATDVAFFREHHAYLQLMTRLRSSDFDVVHNNSLHYLPLAMADTLPMPMVSVFHTPPFCWLESGVRSYRGSNATFVSVSQSLGRDWGRIIPVDRTVYNGIDLARFPYRAQPHEAPYLVWYGRIVPEKGLHHAIAAASEGGHRLRIAGPISNRDYYEAQIAPHLNERITHEGHLDHDQLAQLIGGARAALCTPQWNEPYGLVVAEALACGVPVVAFDRGAIGEILTRETGILCEPNNVAALGAGIAAARAIDRRACRDRAEQFCDMRHMVAAYDLLYRQCIARHQHDTPLLTFATPAAVKEAVSA